MAEKRVIEYEAASELANDDWLLIDGVTEGTRKARPSTVTAELGAQVTNLASTVGGLTQVAMGHEQSFAPDYDESASYDVGDLVMQYHGLYKCTAPTTGTWDAGKWARTEVSEQLEESGKIDDVQVNGVSVVTDKVASIDLTGMQADIDSKQADTKIGGASILDNNKVANLDFLASYGEASGSIASFNDGAAMPLKSLKVGIEAVQDLHGYDNPWSAGGGKNKFNTDFENTTINGTTIKKTSDGRVLTSGVPTSPFDFVIGHVSLPAGSYILNGCPANGGSNKYRLQVTDYPVVNNLGLDYGSGVSFTLEQDMEIAVRIQVYTGASATLEYKPMIRLESVSDSTYAPYSNICPIEGWSAVNRFRCGDTTELPYFVNLSKGIYGVIDLGSLSWSYQTTIVEDIGVFRASISGMTEGSTMFSCPLYENVKTRSNLATNDMTMARLNSSSSVVLIRNDSYTDAIAFQIAMSGAKLIYELSEPTAPTVTPSELQAIISSYNVTSQIYTTTLKDGQGNPMTCYGGQLVNENGVQTLDETMDIVALGSLGWSYIVDSDYTNGGYFRSTQYTNMSSNTINILCGSYLPAGVQGKNAVIDKYGASANNIIYTASSSNRFYILDSAYTDVDQFKTYLQSANVQLVYELATPQQIPQDSLSIATQEGTNNLWADSGDVLECKYVRDNSAVINDLIARVTALENA